MRFDRQIIRIKTALIDVTALAVGCLLYAGLAWLPVLGPILTGFTVGYIRGGTFRKAFALGAASGLSGSILILLLASNLGLPSMSGTGLLVAALAAWILLAWNAIGVVLTASGAVAGAFCKTLKTILNPTFNKFISRGKDGETYMLCPYCGVGNIISNHRCVECTEGLHAK